MLKLFVLFALANCFGQKILLKNIINSSFVFIDTLSDKYKENKNNIILTSNYT